MGCKLEFESTMAKLIFKLKNMGGLEILVLCSIIGGVLGLFVFRDKNVKAWIAFSLGAVGAALTSFMLVSILFASYLAIPVYSVLGSWLFNLIYKKMANKSTT